jgi:DNA invertase Pin-like site-specific DNA recombinase
LSVSSARSAVDLYLHKQAIDTSTPAGKALFQMIGVFSEFEVDMIRERTRAGLNRARDKGKRLGRPPLDTARTAAVRQALSDGVSPAASGAHTRAVPGPAALSGPCQGTRLWGSQGIFRDD